MSNGEYQVMLNSMNVLLKNEVDFSSFFEIQEKEMYLDNKKQSYCTPLFSEELPESSRDKAVIRLLGNKSNTFMDQQSDLDFIYKIFEKFDESAHKAVLNPKDKSHDHHQHMSEEPKWTSREHKILHFFEDLPKRGA